MLNVQTAQSITDLITFFLAYVISITLAGAFTAWIALKMGDDTAQQEGFLTLNPLAHLDVVGIIFLVLFKFGWGKFISINPFNMGPRYRWLKALIAFLAKPIAFFWIGVASIVGLIVLFGPEVIQYIFASSFPAHASSYLLALGLILRSLVIMNSIFTILSLIINLCGVIMLFYVESRPDYMQYVNIAMIGIPVIIFLIFGNTLILFSLTLLIKTAYALALLLKLI